MLFSWLFKILIFPGIVVHEMSHKFFCDWAGVRVLKVCYFSFKNQSGYVVHEPAEKFRQSLLITIGPFLIGTLVAILFFVLQDQHTKTFNGFLFLWLGISVAALSFPSGGDAKALYLQTKRQIWRNPLAILGFPIALFLWVISLLSFVWLNFIYAFLLFGEVSGWLKQ